MGYITVYAYRTIRLADLGSLHLAELMACHFELTATDQEYHDPNRRQTRERANTTAITIENYLGAARRQMRALCSLDRVAKRGLFDDQSSAESEEKLRAKTFRASGQLQTQFHFFAICVCQVSRLLPILIEDCGVPMEADVFPIADRAFLESFRVLRDFFEHFDERLPGRPPKGKSPGEGALVRGRSPWASEIGMQRNELGQVTIGEEAWDFSPADLKRMERIVRRVESRIRSELIIGITKHVGDNPDARIQVPLSLMGSPF